MNFLKYPALLGLLAVALAGAIFVGTTEAAGTSVPLGTAGNFAILAGSGITNTGQTTIVGDTGSSPTSSETGFAACPGSADCITQTGANHADPDPNDSATQSAKAALTNAYNVAAGQSPTTIPTELAGQTLAPGVYTSASGTFGMSGTLTLDAGSDPHAAFIFQTAEGTGTLITGATGNVSLIGAAQSCNVFWKIGTSATLGAGSTFKGIIMAHTSISLGAAVTVEGSLFAGEQASGAGAVTLINDTIKKATCAAPATTTVATTTITATTTIPVPSATPPVGTSPAAKLAPSNAASTKTVAAKVAAKKAAAALAAKRAAIKLAAKKVKAKTGKATSTNTTSTRIRKSQAKPPIHLTGFTG